MSEFIYCTYCRDTQWIHALLQHPCPYCNLEEYKGWKQHQGEDSTDDTNQLDPRVDHWWEKSEE